jgi:hypothetical protein
MTDANTDTKNANADDQHDLGENGKKALAAERAARRDAEKRLKEAEAKLAERERADLVTEVASAKGIDAALAGRLKGSTREELEADADELLELIGSGEGSSDAPPGERPTERLRGGGDPTTVPDDPGGLADRILAG